MSDSHSTLVYSTGQGSTCPACGHKLQKCKCSNRKNPMPNDGIVRVRREVKGRKGKPVTVVFGLSMPTESLKELAGDLKRKCGCGGTAKDGQIIIQGDKVAIVCQELQNRGFQAKKAGG